MKREQIQEARTGKGDYASGISHEISDEEEPEQQTKEKSVKFCKWCGKVTNHKSWVSKKCVAHNEYLLYRKEKQVKKVRTISNKIIIHLLL